MLVLLALLAACGTKRKTAEAPAAETRSAAQIAAQLAREREMRIPEARRRIATYIFGEAAKQYSLNNADATYDLLRQTLLVNPSHAPSLALLAQFESYLRNPQLADSLLREALALDPTNEEYLEANASLALQGDSVGRAIDAVERLAAVRPHSAAVLSQLTNLYMKANLPDSAIRTLERVENIQGLTEQIAHTKHVLRLATGDTLTAMDELRRLVEEYPNDPNYAVLLGNAYMRVMDDTDTARVIFDRVAATDPSNGALQLARLNLYERTDSSLYTLYRDSLLYGADTDPELRSSMMIRFVGKHQHDSVGRVRVIAMFDSVLSRPQEDSRLLSTYAAYLMAANVGGDTICNVLERMLEVEPSNRAATLELLQRYATANNTDGVMRVCDQAITYYPHESIYYYYSALGHYIKGDTLTALDRATVGCEHLTSETPVSAAASLYSMQGDILYHLGRKDEAFAAYDSCLVYQSDDIMCLNNYAYYLSLENRDLDKAERMSYRTLRAQPDSRTYLDTYAWILFLQKRYEEAANYMDRVMEGISTDVEEEPEEVSADVFEHAGDIYACNGDIKRALPYWEAAKRLGCKSKTLAQKIRKRKYVEKK